LELISLAGVDGGIVSILKIELNKKIRSVLARTKSELRRRMMPRKKNVNET
jgi:hypothetical protein